MISPFSFFSDTKEEHDGSLKLMNAIPKPLMSKSEAEERKRKLDEDEDEHLAQQTAKKAKVSHQIIDNVVVLEDDEEEIVLLD